MRAITYATAQILRVLPRAGVKPAAGWLADRSWSRPVGEAVVGVYSRAYDVSLDDCAESAAAGRASTTSSRAPSATVLGRWIATRA